MKLLVADDDQTLREELAGLLREDGHVVVTAADGGEAVKIVDRESFVVALLDLCMAKAPAGRSSIACGSSVPRPPS